MEIIDGKEVKIIPTERWEEWSTMFTNGNRGRSLKIEIKKSEGGIKRLVENLPLVAIDYDPLNKGNIFTVSYDKKENPGRHFIKEPKKLIEMQDKKGVVVAVTLEDSKGEQNIILLK